MNDKLNETATSNDETQLSEGELEAANGGILPALVAGIVLWNVFMVVKEAH